MYRPLREYILRTDVLGPWCAETAFEVCRSTVESSSHSCKLHCYTIHSLQALWLFSSCRNAGGPTKSKLRRSIEHFTTMPLEEIERDTIIRLLNVTWDELGRLDGPKLLTLLDNRGLSADEETRVVNVWRQHPVRQSCKCLFSSLTLRISEMIFFFCFATCRAQTQGGNQPVKRTEPDHLHHAKPLGPRKHCRS